MTMGMETTMRKMNAMKSLPFALGVFLSILTGGAQAADQAAFTPITQFDMWPTGAVLYFSSSPDSNNSCGGNATQFHLLKTQTSFTEIYASLLTAYANSSKVRLRYDWSGTDALISASRSVP